MPWVKGKNWNHQCVLHQGKENRIIRICPDNATIDQEMNQRLTRGRNRLNTLGHTRKICTNPTACVRNALCLSRVNDKPIHRNTPIRRIYMG